MDTSTSLGRREFLKTGLLGFAGVTLLPSCLKNYTPFRFFTIQEAALMSAICEQIIPADKNGPGATQAGVIYYIDKQLDEVFHGDQQSYRKGLAALGESCQNLTGKAFTDLDPEEQLNILKKMEAEEFVEDYWKQKSSAQLFSTMVKHSMQGFYGPPRHGGNKNYISYKLMQLDYPYVVGQNRYRERPLSHN